MHVFLLLSKICLLVQAMHFFLDLDHTFPSRLQLCFHTFYISFWEFFCFSLSLRLLSSRKRLIISSFVANSYCNCVSSCWRIMFCLTKISFFVCLFDDSFSKLLSKVFIFKYLLKFLLLRTQAFSRFP